MSNSEPIAQVVGHLETAELDLAVLFGSRARNQSRADSDWDIGILPGSVPVDLLRLAAELGRLVKGRVDVVNLRRAPPLLCMAVVQEGRVLVDRTGSEWARFASLSLRRYSDTAKLRRAQNESLDAFIAQRTKS